jgi:hypothetical protein
MSEVTHILSAIEQGEPGAAEGSMSLVCDGPSGSGARELTRESPRRECHRPGLTPVRRPSPSCKS